MCKRFACFADLVLYLTQPEGFITGMAAKMFTVAGPVIVYGVTASVIYGIILVLLQSF